MFGRDSADIVTSAFPAVVATLAALGQRVDIMW